MSLPRLWHFVSVSEAEKQHRRELLDLRGNYAQLSIIVAIVFLRLYNTFSPSGQRREKPSRSSRQKSWLDSPPFSRSFDTRRQYLLCMIWLVWLLGLSIWGTNDDYLHLTKALGHVGLSQLPLQVAMSPALYITSTPRASSLLSILTFIPQPIITAYHRVFARVVILPLLAGHATLYGLFFLQSSHPDYSSLLAKRIRDLDVQWGITAVTMAVAVIVFTRPTRATGGLWKGSIKAKARFFYTVHVLLVAALCLAAYLHVAQAQVFVLESVGGFLVNLWCCYVTAQ